MKVDVETITLNENTCSYGDSKWTVKTIIDAAQDCEVYDLQLAALDLDVTPWGEFSIHSMCVHSKRIDKCSLDHPIIQAPSGWILDGWHRICKAILNGDETIKAKRLKFLPEPNL